MYGDDLRRKLLSAYGAGGGTLEELAERFVVSLGLAKKISPQQNRTGQAEVRITNLVANHGSEPRRSSKRLGGYGRNPI